MHSFVTVAFGRQRSLACNEAGSADKGLNSAGSTTDKSLTSPSALIPGKRETMFCSFSRVGLAKTDDANTAHSLAKHQYMQPIIEIADRDET